MSPTDSDDQLLSVMLLGLPVALHHQAVEHLQALQREFDILRAGGDPEGVPARLGILIEELEQRYGDTSPRSCDDPRHPRRPAADVTACRSDQR